jgi:hypothetical protein
MLSAAGLERDRVRHFGGEEIFVVHGVFEDENDLYPKGF